MVIVVDSIDEEEWFVMKIVLNDVIEKFIVFCIVEGNVMKEDL